MLKSTRIAICLMLLAGAGALTGHAQTSAQNPSAKAVTPVEIKLERRKVVLVDGKETLQDAAIAKPGDVLQEVVTYTNNSKATVSKLEATLPVPTNTELLAGSFKPNTAFASTDDKNFAAIPLKRKLRAANGVEAEQLVPVAAYRYLRWYPGDLAAGKSLVFSARFKVADDKPATSGASGIATDNKIK